MQLGEPPSLCQEPSETDAGTSTLVGNAPLSVQNRTNLPDTLSWFPLPKSEDLERLLARRPPREPDEGDLVRQAKLVVRSSCRLETS